MLATSRAATGNDLVVSTVTMSPASPAAGQAVTFSATVQNAGTTAVPAGVVVGASFSIDGTKVSANESNTAGLAAGASVVLTGTTTWTATTGAHTLVATADDTNAIPDEVSESNNTKNLPFTIGSTGSLYVTPVTTNVLINDNFVVTVRLTPGTTVDGVVADLAYDQTKLQYVSADSTGTLFTSPLFGPTASGGKVSIASGDLTGGISADGLVVAITFKALAGSGSTSLTLTGNATKAGAYTNPALTSGTVSFSTPDTTPPVTAITSPTNNAGVVNTITVTSTATDAVGVTKVELYVDGILKGTDSSSPYSFSVNTQQLTSSTHNFQTKAYDAAGNVGSSSIVVVNVKNYGEDINQDGTVNLLDFSILSTNFGLSGAAIKNTRADINQDGTVNLLDFSLLAIRFGQ
jgi:hypothetical protein